jgi:hypothetical protein
MREEAPGVSANVLTTMPPIVYTAPEGTKTPGKHKPGPK